MSAFTHLHFMRQCAQALRFLSLHSIQHLDIKPQNLLVGRGLLLKLADFGEAYHRNLFREGHCYHPGFTFPYTAPEVFHRKVRYSPAVDMFSFGQLLNEVIFGRYLHSVGKAALPKLQEHYAGRGNMLTLMMPEAASNYGSSSAFQLLQRLVLKNMEV